MQRLLLASCALTLAVFGAGWSLGARFEVVRRARVDAPGEVVHAALARLLEPPAGPRLLPRLARTAEDPGRGLWYDVPGAPRRKIAVLHAPDGRGGTLVTWHDVQHAGGNPLARIGARLGSGRRAREAERVLAALARE
jgi:hypothetical protein